MAKQPSNETAETKLEKKLRKFLGDELVDGILESGAAELEARLVRLGTNEMDTITRQGSDQELIDVTEKKKELEAPYKDAIKGINLQRQFVSMQLEKSGKAPSEPAPTGV